MNISALKLKYYDADYIRDYCSEQGKQSSVLNNYWQKAGNYFAHHADKEITPTEFDSHFNDFEEVYFSEVSLIVRWGIEMSFPGQERMLKMSYITYSLA